MTNIKKFLVLFFCIIAVSPTYAAGDLHFKGNLVSGNLWTTILNMGITTLINGSTHQYKYDNQMQFGGITNSGDNSSKISGFSASDLFGNYGTGVKVGYKTRNRTLVNFFGYGDLDYKITCDKIWTRTDLETKYQDYKTTSHKIQIGVGGNAIIGKDYDNIQVIVDATLLYDIPFALSTDLPECSLQSGMSSRYGVTVAFGRDILKKLGMHLGFWFELSHHDYLKENQFFDSSKYKYYALGFNFTICPWK